MANWGDDYDNKVKDDISFGFLFSFKTMCFYMQRIDEETVEWDKKHPKDKLLRLWINIMIIIQVLLICSFGGFIMATGIFYIFYIYALFVLSKCWKRFKYSTFQYWAMTVAAAVLEFALSRVIQDLVFKV